MPVATLETGETSVQASLIRWIEDNVPNPLIVPSIAGDIAYVVQPNRPMLVSDFTKPIVSVNDIGLIQPSADDLFDALTYVPTDPEPAKRGRFASTVVEIIVWGHQRVQDDAEARVKFIRDAIKANYLLAGELKEDGVTYWAPPIQILDYTQAGAPATANLVHRDRSGLWLSQNWLPNDEHPEIRAWRMLTRIHWPEFWAS